MDPKPVTFGLQLDTSRDDTYPTASQRANLGLSSLLRDLPSATAPDSDAVMNDQLRPLMHFGPNHRAQLQGVHGEPTDHTYQAGGLE